MAYSNSVLEEELKNRVGSNYFHDYDYNSILGKIDFCVRPKQAAGQGELITPSLLWAEAKAGESNPYTSLVQLILTIGKARTYNEYLPPPFLGAFDAQCMAFLPYVDIMAVFAKNDFNWNVTPSNYETREFKELYALVKDTLKAKSLLFYYDRDDAALRAFIKANIVAGRAGVHGIQVDKNNFLAVYLRWLEEVKPSIAADWEAAKAQGIIDADFYLADLLSSDNMTIKDKLYVILKHDIYEFNKRADITGFFTYSNAQFKDGQAAHKAFWAKYERPPREEYWDYIIERRDLLVPQDIRERKGSFFTPKQWVTLSQQYIARALGVNWQDEYTVWDPCAGTGNLLAGLTGTYNIYASTIDKQDVDVMHDRIANGANLLDAHVFQFDFLNDDLNSSKVPQSLREILADPEKRKKLVIYMNPPYAEATSSKTIVRKESNHKANVAESKTKDKYQQLLKQGTKELYVQFLIRIYKEIPGCTIANFSKLTGLQGNHYKEFRDVFLSKLNSLFLIPADTFDNVNGQFPIGFFIWSSIEKEVFQQIVADVYDKEGKCIGTKTIIATPDKNIKDWLREYNKTNAIGDVIAYLVRGSADVQNNRVVFITLCPSQSVIKASNASPITANNLIVNCIFFAVRHVIPHTWLNDRDQFLFPNDGWKADKEFQTDCLAYTLFHGQNRISSRHGTNHWLPFTEQEVDAGERFASTFMTDFMAGKASGAAEKELFDEEGDVSVIASEADNTVIARSRSARSNLSNASIGSIDCHEPLCGSRNDGRVPLSFSPAATAVLDAGREVWRYYHECIKGGAGVNAALYDIREYFQGRDDKGRMNSTSTDAKYTALMARLRGAMDALAKQIEGKVYEYGFLKK